jgi:hypothetical protein
MAIRWPGLATQLQKKIAIFLDKSRHDTNIGLIDIDSKLTNLALIKIKSYYPRAEWAWPMNYIDLLPSLK